MRRTQLYLEDQVWGVLHAQARRENTPFSELVRRAIRERYFGDREQRRNAMQSFIGNRGSRRKQNGLSADEEIRALRAGARLDKLRWE